MTLYISQRMAYSLTAPTDFVYQRVAYIAINYQRTSIYPLHASDFAHSTSMWLRAYNVPIG